MTSKVGEANAALCVSCIAFTIFFFMAPPATTRMMVGDAFSVYDGRYWFLVSNVTVHGNGMHLIFNLMWLWFLGNAMEEAMGSAKYMTFVVASAFVSCGFQLIASLSTGIGISGVVCALAGFIWATRKDVTTFGFIMPDQRLVHFIIILLIMIPLDMLITSFNIAHYAHFGGLAFGLAVGRSSSHGYTKIERLQGIAAVVLMVGFVSTSLVWAPWSKSWKAYNGWKQTVRDFETAVDVYENIEFQRRKREVDRMFGVIDIANDTSKPLTDRVTALTQLRQFEREEAVRCLVAHLALGDKDGMALSELPAVTSLVARRKMATPILLDALGTPLADRERAAAVYVLVAAHTAARAIPLIERRLKDASETTRDPLAASLELAQAYANSDGK